jgi:hypothetical protein
MPEREPVLNGNPSSAGWSGIFHFPYRINAQEELRAHEATGRGGRYRVHAPFLLRTQGSPVTDDVPPSLWPDFSWHASVSERLREPTAPLECRYNTPVGLAIWYDGVRVDIWGSNCQEQLIPFVFSFMRWLRFLSHQPWISDVDRHSPSILKRYFEIDQTGAATSEAYPFIEMVIAEFCFVTDTMWKKAFELAVSGQEVQVYVNFFFEAVNAAATCDYSSAVMDLAMALESCRDYNFSKIHRATDLEGRGPQLDAPFDHTDLLKHLSRDAHAVFSRDFSSEYPAHWPALKNLYVARHHVAHGKGAVFREGREIKRVDRESFGQMLLAAGEALQWMETLRDRRAIYSPPPSRQ